MGRTESEPLVAALVSSVNEAHAEKTAASVNEEKPNARNHPACKLGPVSPTGSKVQSCDDIMGLPEKLIASPLNDSLDAENVQESNKQHSDNSEDDVLLCNELRESGRLRLVELSFDDRPTEGMQEGLNEDNPTGPSVEEVVMVVRHAREQ